VRGLGWAKGLRKGKDDISQWREGEEMEVEQEEKREDGDGERRKEEGGGWRRRTVLGVRVRARRRRGRGSRKRRRRRRRGALSVDGATVAKEEASRNASVISEGSENRRVTTAAGRITIVEVDYAKRERVNKRAAEGKKEK